MNQADVLYVPDVARRLGRSVASIRNAVARGSPWLPPPFRLGRRVAWYRPDFDQALRRLARGSRAAR